MRTRIGAWCDHLVEAGWLLALICVPLYFNAYSWRVFEPDKISILRTLATVSAAAWIVGKIEGFMAHGGDARPSVRAWLRRPLVAPILLTVLAYLVSTAVSIVPKTSLWGSYQRLQGTYSTLSFIVIFALMAGGLRTQAQVRRVLTVIVLTSVPVTLHGLMQHHGLDPLDWAGDVTKRVTSTMGNAIFVAAYLAMVIPVTVARWIQILHSAIGEVQGTARARLVGASTALSIVPLLGWFSLSFSQGILLSLACIAALTVVARYAKRPVSRFAMLGTYGGIAGGQFATLVYSQSRGPLLGLLAGLSVFGLTQLLIHRKRALSLGFLGAAGAVLVALLLMNVPGSPLSALSRVPYLGRLGRVLETTGGSGRVRLVIWQGCVDLITSDPVRALVGYGPESLYVAFNRFYPPELGHLEARIASADRAHNETLDAVATMGLLGLAAYVFLFGALFYAGMSALALIRGPSQRLWFIVSLSVGGLAGVVLPAAFARTWALSGPGLSVGMVAGLGVYLAAMCIQLLARPTAPADRPDLAASRLLLVGGLLGAVVAHFVEIGVAFEIAATRTYLWAFAALIVVSGQAPPEEAPSAPAAVPVAVDRRGRSRQRASKRASPVAVAPKAASRAPAIVAGLLSAVVLATLAWDYTMNPDYLRNPLEIVLGALFKGGGAEGTARSSMAWLVLATFAACLGIWTAELVDGEAAPSRRRWWTILGFVAGAAVAVALPYALVHASALRPGSNPARLSSEYYYLLALIGVAIVVAMGSARATGTRSALGWRAFGYAGLIIGATVLASQANLRIVRADVIYKQGLKLDGDARWDDAIRYYEAAAQTAPAEDYYRLFLGRALLEKAKTMADSPERDAAVEESLRVLQAARALNPLNTDHTANIARAYRSWGENTAAVELKRQRLESALEWFSRAVALSPNNAGLHNEWGLVYSAMGDSEGALSRYEASLRIDPDYGQTHLLIGDVHFGQKRWQDALSSYERALVYKDAVAYAWSRIAVCYAQMEDRERALDASLKVLELVPDDYGTLRNITYLFDQLGNPSEALTYADRALSVAPAAERASLEALRDQLATQASSGG